jgi:BUD22
VRSVLFAAQTKCTNRIWEKKYGKNANHRKKEREASHHVQLQPGDQHRKIHKMHRPPYRRDTKYRSQQHDPGPAEILGDAWRTPVNAMQNMDEKPLHPSWEAKKRLKAKQDVGIVHAQGTKIKF